MLKQQFTCQGSLGPSVRVAAVYLNKPFRTRAPIHRESSRLPASKLSFPTRAKPTSTVCAAAKGSSQIKSSTHSTKTEPTELRVLHPQIEARVTGKLKVSPLHSVHFEVYGNPAGIPVIVVHGGPGAGCFKNHARFFDPTQYRIILLDQRGCGRSTPLGCLEENTTQALVEDMEQIREHLEVDRWVLFGGSWGVALSLVYAQTHPDRVRGIILRGICLMRPQEIGWVYRPGGASKLVPAAFKAYLQAVGHAGEGDDRDVIELYHEQLTSPDSATRSRAAGSWHSLGGAVSRLTSASNVVQSWDGEGWRIRPHVEEKAPHSADRASASEQTQQSAKSSEPRNPSPSGAKRATQEIKAVPMSTFTAQALLECHYCLHDAFLANTPILQGIDQIRHIPTIAVHGRLDFICPACTIWELHEAWPEAEVHVVGGAGHSMYDSLITHELINATERMKTKAT
ncbi:hypothetical protein CYMTET_46484 [Cymbomonas tetramitiformis]|uniref:prolyl aminopeptidase n=1 Tax=Cymbomonas tetramitiformis TaxID=36881 RepID=A0AAE0EXJ4_9CHLO|nr:hypothetical protein CYMTET_46484 [Cymbomonas tetramitiformis]